MSRLPIPLAAFRGPSAGYFEPPEQPEVTEAEFDVEAERAARAITAWDLSDDLSDCIALVEACRARRADLAGEIVMRRFSAYAERLAELELYGRVLNQRLDPEQEINALLPRLADQA